jgi:hypothetical protein
LHALPAANLNPFGQQDMTRRGPTRHSRASLDVYEPSVMHTATQTATDRAIIFKAKIAQS